MEPAERAACPKKREKKPLLKKLLGERKNRPHESTAVNKSGYPE